MFNFKLIFVVIFLFKLPESKSQISDKRLCANEDCTKPISQAKTILAYASPEHNILSFKPNVEVTVYSKAAGSNMDLWGIEVNRVRGYAPKRFLRETKVHTKELLFLVDTELNDKQVPSINSNTHSEIHKHIDANKVPEFEVVEGTTVYLSPDDMIIPTTTETNVLPTITPDKFEENEVTDTIRISNDKETEPLSLNLNGDKVIDGKEVTLNENDKSNLKEEDNKMESGSTVGSLVDNVFQSLSNFLENSKADEKDENDVTVEDEDDVDDYTEDNEEDEDYEDTDDDDDEEEDVEAEVSEEMEKEENLNEKNVNSDENINNSIKKEIQSVSNSDKSGNNHIIEEHISIEKSEVERQIALEKNLDIVNTRQLLSEEDMSKYVEEIKEELNQEDTIKEGFENNPKSASSEDLNTDTQAKPDEESILGITESVTRVEHTTENNLHTIHPEKSIISDVSENIDATENSSTTVAPIPEIIETETAESATQPSSLDSSGFEIPVPDDYVTPNPVQSNDNVKEIHDSDSSANIPEINLTDENVNQNINKEENAKDIEESYYITENNENIIDSDKNDVRTENLISSDISSNIELNEPKIEQNIELDNQEDTQEVNPAPTVEEHSESKSTERNTGDNNEEATLSAEAEDQQINTDPGMLSGIYSNWFGSSRNSVQDVSKETNIPGGTDEVGNQVQEFVDERQNSKSSEEQTEEIAKIANENHSEEQNTINAIEQHDHSFSSVTADQNQQISSEDIESSYSEARELENIDLPFSESQELENIDSPSLESQQFETEVTTELPVAEDVIPDLSEQQGTDTENVATELPVEDVTPELSEQQSVVTRETSADSFDKLGDEKNSHAPENSHILEDHLLSKGSVDYGSCPAEGDCSSFDILAIQKQLEMEEAAANSSLFETTDYVNLFTVLGVTGLSVVLFLLGYISIDRNRKEGPLIAKINTLEKALLVASKENQMLVDKVTAIQDESASEHNRISNEELEKMKEAYEELVVTKSSLEEQVQSLEKELENSTEVGLELNRMLSEILSSQNGSDILIANVEQLQRQLVEQQSTINSINDMLNLKDTENHELQLELEIKNKKVTHLQTELDKMAMNLFKVEEDKEHMQAKLEGEIIDLKDEFEKAKNLFNSTRTKLLDEISILKSKYVEVQRNLDVKLSEYAILKDNFNQIKTIKNNTEALESLLNASATKAELQQLQRDNQTLNDLLRQEQQTKFTLEKQIEIALQEAKSYKEKYDESDKGKLEAQTKLEVLSNYFKEKEAHLQKELSKQESLWIEHQGEATSTVERIRYMQEELQNFKSQNELLKQEIVSQEVELKSQISVLEKKAHESWLTARQAERRLEDAKQEAAQLRNRLTLKERSFVEDKTQNRIQSPLEQNGDVAVSPLHMPVESPASPPLLFGTRDHLTTSPPIPNLPPFLPPPPGVPFMPPPIPGVPGFMPPLPSMFPVDHHRPPPLGRMSSPPPPLNSRYSPDSRYSPYDRNSPSPPYDDDYGSSPPPPPMHRGYSPYNNRDDRREYKRPPPPSVRTNGRNKGAMSSGSGNSNESLEKISRHHSKV